MRKPTICIYENKGADQLRGNREADQRLCFSLNGKYKPSSTYIQNFKHLAFFLCFDRPVYVRPGRKPHCWFPHAAAQMKIRVILNDYEAGSDAY